MRQDVAAPRLIPSEPADLPELQAVLDDLPLSNTLTFLHRDGQSFEPLAFTCWFRRAALAAGLPHGRTAHGLRKALGRRLAEAGCSANIIAAILGHNDWREIRRYRRRRTARLGPAGLGRRGGRLWWRTEHDRNIFWEIASETSWEKGLKAKETAKNRLPAILPPDSFRHC